MNDGFTLRPNQTLLDEVRHTIQTFIEPGQVTEVRALEVVSGGTFTRTYSGYFTSANAVCAALTWFPEARGIYFIPNPILPDLLARANNQLVQARSGNTTADEHILQRRYFMVDLDPVRPSGISSTDQELEAACRLATRIAEELGQEGWPAPITALSGNGCHLCYRIDLPADDGGLVSRVLAALSDRYSDQVVNIDTNVGNPARGLRLYGTRARKGDNLPLRPHRHSRILSIPSSIQPVFPLLLAKLAAEAPRPTRSPNASRNKGGVDLERWLKQHDVDVTGPKPWKNQCRLWTFPVCPWNPEHRDGAAYIIEFRDGGIAAGCHHNSCQGKGWPELRSLIEPGWRNEVQNPRVPKDASPAIVNAYRRRFRGKR